MKQHKRRSKGSEHWDREFADALCDGDSQRLSSQRQAQRKAQQFCREVQRALNLALIARGAGGAEGIYIDHVSPAPDCGRLLAHAVIPDGLPLADAMSALRQDASRLRSEVARAIARKRAPELSFTAAFPDGGYDE